MKKRPVHSRGSLVRTACAVGHDPRAPAARELAGTADTGFYDAHGPAELTAGNGLSPELGAIAVALPTRPRGAGRSAGWPG